MGHACRAWMTGIVDAPLAVTVAVEAPGAARESTGPASCTLWRVPIV